MLNIKVTYVHIHFREEKRIAAFSGLPYSLFLSVIISPRKMLFLT